MVELQVIGAQKIFLGCHILSLKHDASCTYTLYLSSSTRIVLSNINFFVYLKCLSRTRIKDSENRFLTFPTFVMCYYVLLMLCILVYILLSKTDCKT